MNNQNPFAPAVRAKSKLRLAINGVAGSGKTYTALKVASNMVTPGRRNNGQARIAMIDSERGSARLYAGVDGLQPFDVLELQANSAGVIMPELYLDAIRMAEQYGYEFLIIDSLSHAWEGVLEVKAQLDKKPNSNSYTNWRDVTPLHNRLVDSILSYNGHVIACMRVKMEHVIEKDDRGKNVVRKVGLKSVMRDGVEYEFSVVMDMSDDNSGAITKTRCMELTGQIIAKPGVELAHTLNQWLETGIEPVERPWTEAEAKEFVGYWLARNWESDAIKMALGITRLGDWQYSARAAHKVLNKLTQDEYEVSQMFTDGLTGQFVEGLDGDDNHDIKGGL